MEEQIIDVRSLTTEYRTAVDAMTNASKEMVKPGITEARMAELSEQMKRADGDEKRLNTALQAAIASNEANRRMAGMVVETVEKGRPKGATVDNSKELQERHYAIFPKMMLRGLQNLTEEERQIIQQVEKRGTSTQVEGTAGLGGNLVPTLFQAEMVKVMKSYSGILQVASVKTTDKGGTMEWPKRDFTARKAVKTAESGSSARQDITWSKIQLDLYKYTDELRVSSELLTDAAYDVYGEFLEAFGESFGRAANETLTVGDGSGDPNGLITALTGGLTAASASAITLPEVIALEHQLDPAYRFGPNCGFMLNDKILLEIKKLSLAATNEGAGTWQPNFASAAPATISGYRYWLNQDMASTVATTNIVAAFGDFSKYWVRRIGSGMVVKRNDYLFMGSDEVGFYAIDRWDGELSDANAVKWYKMA